MIPACQNLVQCHQLRAKGDHERKGVVRPDVWARPDIAAWERFRTKVAASELGRASPELRCAVKPELAGLDFALPERFLTENRCRRIAERRIREFRASD